MDFAYRAVAACLPAVLALTAAAGARAQTLDAVVVTARDQAGLLERLPSDTLLGLAKPLIATPRSASFISSQTLARYGVQTVDRLGAVTPGAYTASFFGVPGSLNVRGTLAETYVRGFKRIENRGTYSTPIADAARIDIVLLNGDPNPRRPDLPHYGAGEAACRPTIAAVANAIFDATGVRLRRVPFRDARVLAALRAAGVA